MSQKKPPRKVPRTGWKLPPCCLSCEAENSFEERTVPCVQEIRGEDVHYKGPKWVCKECGAAFMSPAQATQGVKLAVKAYQVNHGLMTAAEISEGRKRMGLSSQDLADETDLGVATIKRLEAGTTVQRKTTNKILLRTLAENDVLPDYEIAIEIPGIGRPCAFFPSPCPWEDERPWNQNSWSWSSQFRESQDFTPDFLTPQPVG
ncbi:MAG: type II TA system antitoxin MqsA family protein [Verrucomicrobiota bacterium JB025]|nr:hypothetical protein [Verrucomicrobiota bacterium JB025]